MGGILSLPCFRRRIRRRAAPPAPTRSISHPRPLVRRQGSRTSAATTRSVRPRRRQLTPTVEERRENLIGMGQGTDTETEGMDMDIDKDVSMELDEKGEGDLDAVERDINFDMDLAELELEPLDLGVGPAMPGKTDTELLCTDTAPPSVLALPLLPSLPSLPSFPSLALSLPSCPSSISLSHLPLDLPTDSGSLPHDPLDVDIPRPTSTPSLRIARSPTRTRTRSQSLHSVLPGPSVARRRLSHTSHLSLTHRASSSTLHTRRSVHFRDPVVDEGSDDTHCSAATRGTVLTHKTHGTSATTDTTGTCGTTDTMGTNTSAVSRSTMESAALLGPHSTDTSLSTLDTCTTVRTPTSSLNNLHTALFPRHVSRASVRRLRKIRRIDGWEFIGHSELAGWSESAHASHSL